MINYDKQFLIRFIINYIIRTNFDVYLFCRRMFQTWIYFGDGFFRRVFNWATDFSGVDLI